MWKRKGLTWMLDGFARAAARNPSLRLDIVGGGSDKSEAKVKAEIAKRNLQSRVRLRGKVPNAQLLTELPNYRGLLLPSVNETFGMVYVEALFAGVPVIFTAGSAIDGYLDGLDVARTVPPRDVPAIADAILEVDALTDSLRENIRQAAPTLFARFDPETALAGYRADIEAVLAPQE
jgi:glycosyltransferase involved in cell wall biosynthesis